MSETRIIKTADDLITLRADESFHEGALSRLTFPTALPIGYLGYENDKAMFGKLVRVGSTVTKGPAGDFEVSVTA